MDGGIALTLELNGFGCLIFAWASTAFFPAVLAGWRVMFFGLLAFCSCKA